MTHTLLPTFGEQFIGHLVLIFVYQRHSIIKPPALLNVLIKLSKNLLRAHCGAHQKQWDRYLDLVEFAFNHAENASTKQTPFFLNYRQHRETLLSMALPRADNNPAAHAYLTQRLWAQEQARAFLAQNRQQHQFNQHRRDLEFRIGDVIMLSTRHIDPPAHMCRRLSDRHIGPYRVLQRIGTVAYCIDLPAQLQIHPVFHVSLLKHYQGTSLGVRHPFGVLEQWSMKLRNFFVNAGSAASCSS